MERRYIHGRGIETQKIPLHVGGLPESRQGLDGFTGLPRGEAELIKTLQIEPEFRSCAKEMG